MDLNTNKCLQQTTALIKDGFREGTDEFFRPWKALVKMVKAIFQH